MKLTKHALPLSRTTQAIVTCIMCLSGCQATGQGHTGMVEHTGSDSENTCLWYQDLDGDGYGDSDVFSRGACTQPPEGGSFLAGDCDDEDPTVSPGTDETCNGVDDDCDGSVDEDLEQTWYQDLDGDGHGSPSHSTRACEIPAGYAASDDDCDDADPRVFTGADEICDGLDNDCDGTSDSGVPGSSEICAVDSCLDLLLALPDSPDGAYPLLMPSGEIYHLYCDMSTDGGGWTLAFLKNSVDWGTYGSFGSGYSDPTQLGASPQQASLSGEASGGWIDLNDFPYDSMVLAAYGDGAQSYRSQAIAREELRISFGQDGYLLYGDGSGYYWCGGSHPFTDTGIGQVNTPDGATSDCKGHGSLGSGWDFSDSLSTNQGLTMCGVDASSRFMSASWGGNWVYYPTPGAAQAIWVR